MDAGVPRDHEKAMLAPRATRFDKYLVSVEMAVPNRRRELGLWSVRAAHVGHAHIWTKCARARELEAL